MQFKIRQLPVDGDRPEEFERTLRFESQKEYQRWFDEETALGLWRCERGDDDKKKEKRNARRRQSYASSKTDAGVYLMDSADRGC
jgi:hypothetical protein